MNIKLPPKLKIQLDRVARKARRSPESMVIDILEGELPRKEAMADFVRAALASDTKAEAGAPVYEANSVYEWMERLARGEKLPRPEPIK